MAEEEEEEERIMGAGSDGSCCGIDGCIPTPIPLPAPLSSLTP